MTTNDLATSFSISGIATGDLETLDSETSLQQSRKRTKAVKGDWETNRRDDLQAFQDQRYRRFRPPDNGAQRADLRHEMGRGPSSRNKSSQMKSHWRILYFRQLEKFDQLKPLVALWIHDTGQKSEYRRYTKLKRMVTRDREQKLRGKNLTL